MVWWLLANVVLTIHVLLFVVIVVGLLLAAIGVLKRYKKVSFVYWSVTIATLISQLIPGCQLTTIERWMRHQVDPSWEREYSSIARTLTNEFLGTDLPDKFFTGLAVILGVVVAMVFIRNYGKSLR